MGQVDVGRVKNHNRIGTIIFLNRFFYPDHSATSQLLADLAFDLANEGYMVRVITSRQRYNDPLANLAAREVINDVEIYRVWTSTFGRSLLLGRVIDYATFYGSSFLRLWLIVRPGNIIVAKTDPPLISVIAALVAKLKSASLVNWVQDLFPEVAKALRIKGVGGLSFKLLTYLRNTSLKNASANVVLGELMAERLREEGVKPEKIKIIHNWADSDRMRPIPPGENPLRQEWGLQDRFVVGYSGNLGRAHSFEALLHAATELRGVERIAFLIIGDGAQLDAFKKEIARRGLRSFVFKPYQPRNILSESLSVSDCHLVSLLPELEGFIVPSKFYAIAAVGRPVLFVGDKDGEIPRLLGTYECGFTVSLENSGDLAKRIFQLYGDRQLTANLGRRARTLFESQFSSREALPKWRDVLCGALRRSAVGIAQPQD